MRNLVLVALLVAVAAAGGKAGKHAKKDDVVHQTPPVIDTQLTETGKKIVWGGFIGVALPAAYFAYVTNGIPDGAKKYHIYTTFICAIATLAYLTMATGHGVYTRPFDQREFFYARYIDWALTTPLMLLDLLGFAGADSDTTYFLVGCDVIMIVSGLMASFMEGQEKYYFWAFGMMVFMPIIYYLSQLKSSKTCTDRPAIGDMYNKIANLTILTWCCYPIVWLMAEGQGKISADTEALCYTVLDVLAKSVFGFIIIRARVHEEVGSTPATTVTASANAAPAPADGSML